ncbi:MAG: hypothetical protein ACLFUS_14735 [Candidatus Sumerlaeia bacterium]
MNAVSGLPGQMVSILRQELDSLVRVIFLLSQADRRYRQALIDDSVMGRKWTQPESRKPVTDREMVELADTLHGWTKSVYSFGCAFIHLSSFHDYLERDPFKQLPPEERAAVIGHVRNYHGGMEGPSPTFQDLVPFLPRVFEKIAGNLEYYVSELEADGDID